MTRVGDYWYAARVATGFYAVADFIEPNRHFAILDEKQLAAFKATGKLEGRAFEGSPYVLTTTQVEGLSNYDLETIRYGRVETVGEKPFAIIDGLEPVIGKLRTILGDQSS